MSDLSELAHRAAFYHGMSSQRTKRIYEGELQAYAESLGYSFEHWQQTNFWKKKSEILGEKQYLREELNAINDTLLAIKNALDVLVHKTEKTDLSELKPILSPIQTVTESLNNTVVQSNNTVMNQNHTVIEKIYGSEKWQTARCMLPECNKEFLQKPTHKKFCSPEHKTQFNNQNPKK